MARARASTKAISSSKPKAAASSSKPKAAANGKAAAANGKAVGRAARKKKQTAASNGSGQGSYDRFKEHEGKRYTGVAVGRGHKWRYAEGVWAEKKVTPDEWEFHYDVHKRRNGKAPEGSGAPVGTAYHWYILAHQTVTKLDANEYDTRMQGIKYKLAHKRAEKASWSASERAQRRRLIGLLKQTLAALEAEEAAEPARGARAAGEAPQIGAEVEKALPLPPARAKERENGSSKSRRAA